MQNESFSTLLEGLSDIAGIDPADPLVLNGQFEIDGIDFSLAFAESATATEVLVYCDFGAVNTHNGRAQFVELLGRNLTLHDGAHTTAFGISPETERILLMTSTDLACATPSSLLELLVQCTGLAKGWRTGSWTYLEQPVEAVHRG